MKSLQVTIIVCVVLFFGSRAGALSPIGPATSEAKKGDFSLGLEFFQGEIDVTGTVFGVKTSGENKPLGGFVRPGYSLADGSEFFGRFGIGRLDEHGSNEMAWGFGAKTTLASKGDLSCGILGQMDWAYEKDDDLSMPYYAEWDMEMRTALIAFGVTLQKESLAVYGGPFVRFIDWDLDWHVNGIRVPSEMENESEVGGYIGISLGTEAACLNVECQKTRSSWLMATGVTLRF